MALMNVTCSDLETYFQIQELQYWRQTMADSERFPGFSLGLTSAEFEKVSEADVFGSLEIFSVGQDRSYQRRPAHI
jgi:hypothetical protein